MEYEEYIYRFIRRVIYKMKKMYISIKKYVKQKYNFYIKNTFTKEKYIAFMKKYTIDFIKSLLIYLPMHRRPDIIFTFDNVSLCSINELDEDIINDYINVFDDSKLFSYLLTYVNICDDYKYITDILIGNINIGLPYTISNDLFAEFIIILSEQHENGIYLNLIFNNYLPEKKEYSQISTKL